MGFDPFDRGDEDEDGENGEEEALGVEASVVKVLREMLELEGDGGVKSRPKAFDTPVFLGHGTEDDKVPVARGRGAAECLRAAGMHVEWKEYSGLGHWYSADMLTDIASFLADQARWEQEDEVS
jgi:acetyl esterase/lipase